MQYDVVIVGAGTAGFALAFLLARRGIRVTVLDGRKGIPPILRPEIMQPLLLERIAEVGLLPEILAHPHQTCSDFHFYTTEGNRLCHVDYRLLKHPFPYTIIALPTVLQEVLKARLDASEATQVHWGTPVLDVLREDARIVGCVAEVAGKRVEVRAPVIVGADGPNSKTRQLLGIPYRLHIYENGFFAFPLRHLRMPSNVEYFLGKGKILGIFPVSSDDGCALYLASSSEMKHRGDFEAFKAWVANVYPVPSLDALRSWDQVTASVCSRVRARSWVMDGVCLIGDAAHATHPHMAQGTTQAFEDALMLDKVLADCFRVGDFSAKRLEAYEAARRPLVTRLQRLADEYVWLWDTGNPLLAFLRNRAFRNVGENPQLSYKTIASEAGLHTEGLTVWDRFRAITGI